MSDIAARSTFLDDYMRERHPLVRKAEDVLRMGDLWDVGRLALGACASKDHPILLGRTPKEALTAGLAAAAVLGIDLRHVKTGAGTWEKRSMKDRGEALLRSVHVAMASLGAKRHVTKTDRYAARLIRRRGLTMGLAIAGAQLVSSSDPIAIEERAPGWVLSKWTDDKAWGKDTVRRRLRSSTVVWAGGPSGCISGMEERARLHAAGNPLGNMSTRAQLGLTDEEWNLTPMSAQPRKANAA